MTDTATRTRPVSGRVLAVDDQPDNLALLEEVLGEEGYEVSLAADGEEALTQVVRQAPDCIVLDIMMPRLDGFGVCSRLKSCRDTHFIPILMLTALSEVKDKVRAFELGADDFLNKPVNVHELVARVRSLVRIKRLRDELDTSENIIVSMVQALESKDPSVAGHSQRVAWMGVQLARRIGLGPDRVEVVAKGAMLHDIGKIGLPERLMSGPTLSRFEDLAEYRHHAAMGERILAPFLSFSKVRALVRHHHERLDGSGYPDGLSGEDFATEIEIVAAANALDGLLVRLPAEAAQAEMRQAAATGAFHTDLVEELLAVAEEMPPSGVAPPAWQDLLSFPTPARPGRLLLADDTAANREVLQEVLTAEGHSVLTVGAGDDALSSVDEFKPDLVLLDVHMPGMSGFEVCRRIKDDPETEFLPVVLLTAHHDLAREYRTGQVWADDFLLQPINRLELIARVKSLLRLRMYFRDLEDHQSVILSLAAALEAKDPYTRGHSERVGVLAGQLARVLGLDDRFGDLLRVAGQLHDIGKIGMPEALLNKQTRLDDDEFRMVKGHPALGEVICRPLRSMQAILPLIRHHHERFDGSGYPDGLSGEAIPLGARILGLADAYDALTSARSYRKSFNPDDALQLLDTETRGGKWDPAVHTALVTLIRRGVWP